MRVNFYATLRAVAGGKAIDANIGAPITVRTVLESVTRDKPNLAAEIWKTPGELNDLIHVFVNGRETRYLPQGLDTPLDPHDTLDVFPPVGGGDAR
jgi:molybdopterin synthase sulfur carrier subunit